MTNNEALNRFAFTTGLTDNQALRSIARLSSGTDLECWREITGETGMTVNQMINMFAGTTRLTDNAALNILGDLPANLPGDVAYWGTRYPELVLDSDGNPCDYLDPIATLVEPLQGWHATQDVADSRPLYLRNDGLGYLHLPGVAGNYLSAPTASGLPSLNSLDCAFKIAANTYTPGVVQHVAGVFTAEPGGRAWRIVISPTSQIQVSFTSNGNNNTLGTYSFVLPSHATFKEYFLRVTWSASSQEIRLLLSDDEGETWSQVGSTLSARSANLHSSTADFTIGQHLPAQALFAGRIYRVIIRDGIDGPIAFDFDASKVADGATSFTESSVNAATVTVNQSGNNPAQIVRTSKALWDGDDDFFNLPSESLGLFRNVGFGWLAAAGRSRDTSSATRVAIAFARGDATNQSRIRLFSSVGTANRFAFDTNRLDTGIPNTQTSSVDHAAQDNVWIGLSDFTAGSRALRQGGAVVASQTDVQVGGNTPDTNSTGARIGAIPSTNANNFAGTMTDILAGNADPGNKLPALEKWMANPLGITIS